MTGRVYVRDLLSGKVNLTTREIERGYLGPLGTDDPGEDPPAWHPWAFRDTKERAA